MASRTIAFLAGTVAFQLLSRLPSAAEWLFFAGAIPVLLLASRLCRERFVAPLSIFALFLLAGFAWAGWRCAPLVTAGLPPSLEGEDVEVVGTIRDLPLNGEGRTRFDFAPESVTHEGRPVAFRALVRLHWYEGAPLLHAGERWRLTVRLKQPHGMANPGGFDYEAHLFEEGIRATGYVRDHGANQRLAAGGFHVDAWRDGLRERMQTALEGAPRRGVLVALAIGDGSGIGREEWELFRATGTTHLMAISGLHVGLVAALAAWIARRLWYAPGLIHRLPAQKAAALAAFGAALFYGMLAGFSVPTQRTVITIGTVALALFSGRITRPVTLLAVACWAVLLWDPLAVISPGFWLSFGAVGLILYGLGARLEVSGIAWRFGRLQWVLWLGLAPILVAFFGSTSLVSPIANLMAVPWISLLVVPIDLAGTLLLLLWPAAGELLLRLGAGLLDLLWPLLEWLAHWVPPVAMPQLPTWALMAALIGVALLLAPRGWPGRWLGLFWCLPLCLWQPSRPAEGEVWLTLLDVGQGLAAVVETREHLLVFDAGPTLGPEFDAGAAAVVPFLQARGWSRVDTLLISHGDDDHAGGALSVTGALRVARRLAATSSEPGWERCRRGQTWAWSGVRFRVIHPENAEGRNDGSCVLRVESPAGALLLTGDIEAGAERALLASGEPLGARVLLVPHHGSRSSSTAPFIEAVWPEVALLSTGYRNRFRFPSGVVVARYEERGVRLVNTAREGAITIRMGTGAPLAVEGHRARVRHYWDGTESLGARGALW